MKQLIFLIACTVLAAVGSLFHPFWGLLLYYTWAVLRPQALWEWALSGEIRWSLIAATILLLSLLIHAGMLIRTIRMNLMTVLMLAYSTLLLLSVVTSLDPLLSERWAVDYAKVMLMAVIATMLITEFWQVRVLVMMVAASIGYIAYTVNMQYFFEGYRLDIYHYGYGGLDNNGAGLMLAMGLPLAYALAFVKPAKGSRLGWLMPASAVFGCALLIHAVMMTYSRGAMLAGVVGLIWLLFHHRPRFQAVPLIAAAVVAIALMAGPEVQHRFMSTKNYETDSSAQKRLAAWAAAWEMAWERPILGYGIRNSSRYLYNFGADKPGRVIHNNYLQIAADSGIPAAGLYVSILGVSLVLLFRGRRRCIRAIPPKPRDGPWSPHQRAKRNRMEQAARFYLAIQTSLITFAVGAMLLSVENFELPWLLIAMAGAVPLVTQRLIESEEAGPASAGALNEPVGVHDAGRAAVRRLLGSPRTPVPPTPDPWKASS